MKNLQIVSATAFFATALFMAEPARSQPLKVSFPDSAGADFGGKVDVSGMTLSFDNTDGSYELKVQSAAANPFRDSFRIDVNIFNSDILPSVRSRAFFFKALLDYNLGASQTEMIITGTDPVLTNWQAGQIVVGSGPDPLGAPSDGPAAFESSVMDLPVAGSIKGDAIGDHKSALIEWAQPPDISPVWRQLFNVSNKAVYGDLDGDGFPGWAEAAFGTDPGDARSVVRPVIRRDGNALFLEWSAVSGARQQAESSPDLFTWQPIGSPLTSTGALLSIPITAAGTAKYFRIRALPALDSDGDGLDNMEEALLGTNPGLADTDSDGFSDGNEVLTLHTDPLIANSSAFVLIPAGTFQMGDSFNDGGSDERPVHPVNVGAFFMQAKETTKSEWDEVRTWALANGYAFDNTGDGKAADHPVHTVNWFDVVKWCNAKSQKEALMPCYYTDTDQTTVYKTGQVNIANTMVKWSAAGYRLPTEAEWEKAARGGLAARRFPWGDVITHSIANYNSSSFYAYDTSPTRGSHPLYGTGSQPYTSPVGSFAPNAYGLYDMAGNVWEWCWDWYNGGYYSTSPPANPLGAVTGSYRVLRGGSWGSVAGNARVSVRNGYYAGPSGRNGGLGFRLARGPL